MPRLLNLVAPAGGMVLVLAASAVAQHAVEMPATSPGTRSAAGPDGRESSLVDEVAELRAKVARLEAALERNHRGHSSHGGGGSHQPGMGGMGMGGGSGMGGLGMKDLDMKGMKMSGGMGMDGMQMGQRDGAMPMGMNGMGMGGNGMGGMQMMGKMKGMSGGGSGGMGMNSALPGFPGASHLYHVGATGFFLDHSEHIALTAEQAASLNRLKEQALLARNTAARQVDEAEQQLWELTAADTPDAKLVEQKVREIERLRGDQRLGFIRAVGKAAEMLTPQQRRALTGMPVETVPASPAPNTQPASEANHQH